MAQGTGNGGQRRYDRRLTDTLGTIGVAFIGCRFNQDRIDHRQIAGDRHPIVKKAWVFNDTLIVVNIRFVQCPAHALRNATLNLTLNIGRMNRAADVLRGGVAQHGTATGLRI